MAEIRPLRAWRYNDQLAQNIDNLTSPLFDVVSNKQRERLYQEPYNSIHLSVPRGEYPAEEAQVALEQWKKDGIIIQDALPAIYVYYQYFNLPGSKKTYCRKGFICNIRVYDWPENVILRHENTMPHSVNDRIEILEKTALNVSPTHGLYTDTTHELEVYMDESMQAPVFETEDYQGVRDVLAVIHDAERIKRFLAIVKDQQIILADGHHRYTGSLQHMKKMRKANPNHTGQEGYNFHSMYFTNTESDDLRILPTHRLIKSIGSLDEQTFLQKAAAYFNIKTVENHNDINEIILGKPWAFGILFQNSAYKLRLKTEMLETIDWAFPDSVKRLDLTVMHYFIIDKILGIPGKHQRKSDNIVFERNFVKCMTSVFRGEVDLAIVTNDILMDDVKKVCHSGYTLPQKSTYFYPKVICGFVFSSIKENEFTIPAHFSV